MSVCNRGYVIGIKPHDSCSLDVLMGRSIGLELDVFGIGFGFWPEFDGHGPDRDGGWFPDLPLFCLDSWITGGAVGCSVVFGRDELVLSDNPGRLRRLLAISQLRRHQ
ncbi:hypothetical protein NPIL_668551 [Nephila pilipes]|uniref:Uncharacterized protein n=1 Tax=Nephila pilipes TaxID=299642 RepID=A0A8X6TN02_NEPPI|nr:hypothetical protein NPIL_668551 [Nephila pilipes]